MQFSASLHVTTLAVAAFFIAGAKAPAAPSVSVSGQGNQQFGEVLHRCLTVASTRTDWITFQNNCNKRLVFYVMFANQRGSQGGDIEPGEEHAKEVYGNGPYRLFACMHGYEAVQSDGTSSVHYSTTTYKCAYTGQF